MNAEVTRFGVLDMQVCVPHDWTDAEVLAFAESLYSCGTSAGWTIRRQGSPLLQGSPERQQCAECSDNVHIMLDA